jgi:hypothetical protein
MDTRKPVKKRARERTQSEGPLKGERRRWRVIGFSINTSMTILRTSTMSWGLDGDFRTSTMILRTSVRILRASMATSGIRWRFWGPRRQFEGLDGDFRNSMTILRTSTTMWGPRFEDLDYDFEDLDRSSRCQIQAPQSRIQKQLTYRQTGIFHFGTWNLRPRLQN